MSIESLKRKLPGYAKDLKLNLSSLSTEAALTEQQRDGTFLASAIASRNATVPAAILAETEGRMTPEALEAAMAAAANLAMHKVYYRFVQIAATQEYAKLAAWHRMDVNGTPGGE